MCRRTDLLAALAVVTAGAVAFAQQPDRPQPGARPAPGTTATQPAATGQLDAHVADCMILGNQEEVAIAQFAAERATDPQVKQFAQMLADDHQKQIASLQKFSNRQPSGTLASRTVRRDPAVDSPNDRNATKPPATRLPSEDRKPGTPETRTEAAPRTTATGGSLEDQLYALANRAAEECLSLTKEELEKHDGAKFDHAFLGQQIGAHVGMLAKLRAAEEAVSPELQQIVKQAEQATMQHKQKAEQLIDQIAKADTANPRTEAKPGAKEDRGAKRESTAPRADKKE